jgi:hypothetical protein
MNRKILQGIAFSLLLFLVAGCESNPPQTQAKPPAPVVETPAPVVAPPKTEAVAPVPAVLSTTVRINAGGPVYKDPSGNEWAADVGFSGGDTDERPEVTVTNTDVPEIFRSEHYGMDSFSWPLPNGKYTVKLYFSETYEGITGIGQRVFSYDVQGKRFDHLDIWAKAGGAYRAYVETVPVEVTNGKLLITFITEIENPQVNGIEITPQN